MTSMDEDGSTGHHPQCRARSKRHVSQSTKQLSPQADGDPPLCLLHLWLPSICCVSLRCLRPELRRRMSDDWVPPRSRTQWSEYSTVGTVGRYLFHVTCSTGPASPSAEFKVVSARVAGRGRVPCTKTGGGRQSTVPPCHAGLSMPTRPDGPPSSLPWPLGASWRRPCLQLPRVGTSTVQYLDSCGSSVPPPPPRKAQSPTTCTTTTARAPGRHPSPAQPRQRLDDARPPAEPGTTVGYPCRPPPADARSSPRTAARPDLTSAGRGPDRALFANPHRRPPVSWPGPDPMPTQAAPTCPVVHHPASRHRRPGSFFALSSTGQRLLTCCDAPCPCRQRHTSRRCQFGVYESCPLLSCPRPRPPSPPPWTSCASGPSSRRATSRPWPASSRRLAMGMVLACPSRPPTTSAPTCLAASPPTPAASRPSRP